MTARPCVFTGDTLFRGSVGGTRGKGHTTLDRPEALDPRSYCSLCRTTRLVYPGHMEPTTIGEERSQATPSCATGSEMLEEHGGRVRAYEREATLLVDAEDYDGGRKCQLRFLDDGSEDLVAVSRVERIG